MKQIAILLVLIGTLFASDAISVKSLKLSQKGEKIAEALCHKEKLPKAEKNIQILMEKIKTSKACSALSASNLEAVAYYVSHGTKRTKAKHIHVPKEAKCPVCGMLVSKYPKWAASMTIDTKRYYFDGVKDMMKYLLFDGNFPYDRKRISQMRVTDYYTLEAIDAKGAFYVLGSEVYGPMGNELIPFASKQDAQTFYEEHRGKKIVSFNEISDTMVLSLDGM